MKKVFMTMAVLTGLVAGGMVFSSFTEPNQEAKKDCFQQLVNAPVYWEGYANHRSDPAWNNRIYIKVYRTEGQCNSFYAVLTGGEMCLDDDIGRQFWVKENEQRPLGRRYYVTYRNSDYYFNM